MVRRFVGLFGLLPVLFLIAFGVMLGLFFEPLRSSWPRQGILILAICGVPVVFTILAAVIGSFIFRRMGSPVIDVMAAADAVANGDLSARVRENIPGEFGQLAQSFNRMAAELARAEQQRRNLTADVAHELRTPLTTIDGYLEGLEDGVIPPTGETWRLLRTETGRLTRLVNDLSELWRAEARQLPLRIESVDAGAVSAEVAEQFRPQAADRGIAIELALASVPVRADRDRLAQILSNYLSNAIRHAPDGSSIRLAMTSRPTGVQLSVADDGPGLEPDQLEAVFERFYRVDPARSRSAGGSGIGLAIVRALADAMGGSAWAESPGPGRGSTFFVELPAA